MKHVHLVGIGGTGLSAIALVLLESGVEVSGSDRQLSPLTTPLQAAGARVFIGHRAENIQGADLLVRSSAISDDNPEVQAALSLGIPVLKRVDFMRQLTAGKQTIAVAGTHGKTTTTAMIAWMLTALGLDPSYIIGGVSVDLGGNAHAGRGRYFVIEADEYDRMFFGLSPRLAVITNIEHDHPDCYPTPADFTQAFFEFSERLEPGGALVVCADDPGAAQLGRARSASRKVITYGIVEPDSLYRAINLRSNQAGGYDFQVQITGTSSGKLSCSLQVPGEHNVKNALAALAIADELGLAGSQAASALAVFRGTGRRFEVRGIIDGIVVIDDYAHHPTEIRATLSAARARYTGRPIWVVWQPHTYSRTRTLANEFSAAFSEQGDPLAAHVIVTAIYAAREAAPADGFSAAEVIRQMDLPDVRYMPVLAEIGEYLLTALQPGDVLLVLSAGDADQISSQVLNGLEQRRKLFDSDQGSGC
jgi:UDP-N-acetylmuramate--alanine ligase